ncbi:GNAT family N-acetyltransferase [Spirillospora sp. NPDC029432]|uniref:GNAT family N-acetyltransferase n=1 Tax=Spirillospora sp. NPDC029432 TaxID=3154599 RepID=UPI0034571B38
MRLARPTDAKALAELRWVFKQEDHDGRPSQEARPLEQAECWIRDRLDSGRWLAWVAESGGRICGHVFLQLVERMPEPYARNAPIGYVTNFFVTPSHRDRGIGAALLEAMQRHAEKAQLDTLIAWPSDRACGGRVTTGRESAGKPAKRAPHVPGTGACPAHRQ